MAAFPHTIYYQGFIDAEDFVIRYDIFLSQRYHSVTVSSRIKSSASDSVGDVSHSKGFYQDITLNGQAGFHFLLLR